jgi:hypothetical protein
MGVTPLIDPYPYICNCPSHISLYINSNRSNGYFPPLLPYSYTIIPVTLDRPVSKQYQPVSPTVLDPVNSVLNPPKQYPYPLLFTYMRLCVFFSLLFSSSFLEKKSVQSTGSHTSVIV